MKNFYNPKYPDIASLKQKAKKRMPKFAFDYLIGGCIDEIGINRNQHIAESVTLRSELLNPFDKCDMSTELFGHRYNAPFGIAPIGLQGLMWPKAPEILAKAASEMNVPFILSTVSSSSLEKIADISEGKAWFQLYNPSDCSVRKDLMNRIIAAQYSALVITVDVPTFGYRSRDIKNGLSMPPKMSLSNILQILSSPSWALATAIAGKPEMETLKQYMPKNMPTNQLAEFMNKTVMGDVDLESLKPIRDQWKGPLVVKGLINEKDVEAAIALGADAVLISNHGGRQLDLSQSPGEVIQSISKKYGHQIKILMDSGLQSGSQVAGALASGADFTFLGRAFTYGVGALGSHGGVQTINILLKQLEQTMCQLRCATVKQLPHHLVT